MSEFNLPRLNNKNIENMHFPIVGSKSRLKIKKSASVKNSGPHCRILANVQVFTTSSFPDSLRSWTDGNLGY